MFVKVLALLAELKEHELGVPVEDYKEQQA